MTYPCVAHLAPSITGRIGTEEALTYLFPLEGWLLHSGRELQSHFGGLGRFPRLGSVTTAIPVILLRPLVATVVFHRARLAGRPDLLEQRAAQ